MSLSRIVISVPSHDAVRPPAVGAGARAQPGARAVQVEPRRHLSDRCGVAGRQGQDRRRHPEAQAVSRQARHRRRRRWPTRSSGPTRSTRSSVATYVYASMLADLDTRDAAHQGMQQEMVQLAAGFSAEASFLEPEILKFEKGTTTRFIANEPRLKKYEFYLADIERRAAAHAERQGRSAAGDGRTARRRAVERLRHPVQRRLPLSHRDAERRQARSRSTRRTSAPIAAARIARIARP